MGHLFDPVADNLTEIHFQISSDNEYYLVKPGLQRIMDRIIHNDLTVRPHWLQLLDSAAKTAAQAGRHNH